MRPVLFLLQVERVGPAGGAAQPPPGAGLPAQPDGGEPETHGPFLPHAESEAGAPGIPAHALPPQPAPPQRYAQPSGSTPLHLSPH